LQTHKSVGEALTEVGKFACQMLCHFWQDFLQKIKLFRVQS